MKPERGKEGRWGGEGVPHRREGPGKTMAFALSKMGSQWRIPNRGT